MVVRNQKDWLTAKVGDELVMMNTKSSKHIGLTKIGARIWEIIEKLKTVEEICSLLLAQFKVTPETCRAEVDSFLAELAQHDAVTFDSPEAQA
jgi:hypothetical protein